VVKQSTQGHSIWSTTVLEVYLFKVSYSDVKIHNIEAMLDRGSEVSNLAAQDMSIRECIVITNMACHEDLGRNI
jgi:hypothetical protein